MEGGRRRAAARDRLAREADEQLECSVCLEEYTDPRSLVCSHTYCLECVQNLAKEHWLDTGRGTRIERYIICPECREWTILRMNQTLRDLPRPLFLRRFTELRDKLRLGLPGGGSTCLGGSPPSTRVPCDLCQGGSYTYCDDCSLNYCAPCLRKHDDTGAFARHTVVRRAAGGADDNTCARHPGRRCTSYCATCRAALCGMCVLLDHDPGHDILDLKQATGIICRSLAEDVTAESGKDEDREAPPENLEDNRVEKDGEEGDGEELSEVTFECDAAGNPVLPPPTDRSPACVGETDDTESQPCEFPNKPIVTNENSYDDLKAPVKSQVELNVSTVPEYITPGSSSLVSSPVTSTVTETPDMYCLHNEQSTSERFHSQDEKTFSTRDSKVETNEIYAKRSDVNSHTVLTEGSSFQSSVNSTKHITLTSATNFQYAVRKNYRVSARDVAENRGGEECKQDRQERRAKVKRGASISIPVHVIRRGSADAADKTNSCRSADTVRNNPWSDSSLSAPGQSEKYVDVLPKSPNTTTDVSFPWRLSSSSSSSTPSRGLEPDGDLTLPGSVNSHTLTSGGKPPCSEPPRVASPSLADRSDDLSDTVQTVRTARLSQHVSAGRVVFRSSTRTTSQNDGEEDALPTTRASCLESRRDGSLSESLQATRTAPEAPISPVHYKPIAATTCQGTGDNELFTLPGSTTIPLTSPDSDEDVFLPESLARFSSHPQTTILPWASASHSVSSAPEKDAPFDESKHIRRSISQPASSQSLYHSPATTQFDLLLSAPQEGDEDVHLSDSTNTTRIRSNPTPSTRPLYRPPTVTRIAKIRPMGVTNGLAWDGNLQLVLSTTSVSEPVQVFNYQGEAVLSYGRGLLMNAHGVAIDGSGRAAVVDRMMKTVKVFEASGLVVQSVRCREFKGIMHVAPYRGADGGGEENIIAITDRVADRVFLCDLRADQVVRQFGDSSGDARWAPSEIACGGTPSTLYVRDHANLSIKTFDHLGYVTGRYDTGGRYGNWLPRGVGTDTEGNLLVADWNNRKILTLADDQWQCLYSLSGVGRPYSVAMTTGLLAVAVAKRYDGDIVKESDIEVFSVKHLP